MTTVRVQAPRPVLRLRLSARSPRATVARGALRVRAGADDAFAGYKCKTAFLFPGQGAQSVGMAAETAAEVPAAKALFDKASEILGYDLLQVCTEGPAEKLNSTAVSQPAIYVSSMAAVEKLRASEGGQEILDSADIAAGLSLGEYTALAFAGAFSFEDGLKIVKARGEAMQAAADAQPSGMVSVIGLDAEKCNALCAEATEKAGEGSVVVANYLCNGNYACSGSIPGCEAIEEIAKPNYKARMTVRLAVAGAFHTEYMSPAVDSLKEVLATTEFKQPRIPVVSNVDAAPHSDPDTIKDILAKQVTCPVLWENSMKAMQEQGLEQSFELGPGKVVAGIWKRIDKTHTVTNVVV